MENIENFEKRNFSEEIVQEWYQEKEGEELKRNTEKSNGAKEVVPVFPNVSAQDRKNKQKEEEESKKSLIKKEIKFLLAIAEEKGLESSIKEAEKKNNPFLLDVYHDVLAKEASYKNYLKK